MKKNHPFLLWLIPLLLIIAITPFTPWIDLTLSSFAYSQETKSFYSNQFLDFIYVWGVLPGNLLIAGSLLCLLLSFTLDRFRSWRRPSLLLVYTLAIGAGIIVHAMLKDHWGRPRPRQIVEFGGQQQFRPYWKPNFFSQPEPSKSFPCGHCTMGFAFFAFYFLGKRLSKPWLSTAGLSLACILGMTLGITRIAQGGHFFSDVLMCGAILWYTAYFSDRLLYETRGSL